MFSGVCLCDVYLASLAVPSRDRALRLGHPNSMKGLVAAGECGRGNTLGREGHRPAYREAFSPQVLVCNRSLELRRDLRPSLWRQASLSHR